MMAASVALCAAYSQAGNHLGQPARAAHISRLTRSDAKFITVTTDVLKKLSLVGKSLTNLA